MTVRAECLECGWTGKPEDVDTDRVPTGPMELGNVEVISEDCPNCGDGSIEYYSTSDSNTEGDMK